jgi:hypothetical protein
MDTKEKKMKRGELLNKMLVLATTRHAGQFDRGGNPYILHPLKVMYYLKSNDEELQCIALAHDLVEDTDTSYDELREMGFSERIIQGIAALTKQRGDGLSPILMLLRLRWPICGTIRTSGVLRVLRKRISLVLKSISGSTWSCSC